MTTCVLVACCAKKLGTEAKAIDLYQSALFKKSRAFAERYGDRWLILSAKHGVVYPYQTIASYDVSLATMTTQQRTYWYENTSKDLRMALPKRCGLIVLAGRLYRTGLDFSFASWVGIPMEGLGIGQQLRWLSEKLGSNSA